MVGAQRAGVAGDELLAAEVLEGAVDLGVDVLLCLGHAARVGDLELGRAVGVDRFLHAARPGRHEVEIGVARELADVERRPVELQRLHVGERGAGQQGEQQRQ